MIETAFHILKISIIVALCAVFMTAIATFLNLITTLVFHSVIGEVFALASMYLPFNAHTIFGAIIMACNAILSFLIAKKIFDLTSWSFSTI